MRDSCSDGNVLYLDYINVNILVMLYNNFTRLYHWLKGTWDVCIISYNDRNLQLSHCLKIKVKKDFRKFLKRTTLKFLVKFFLNVIFLFAENHEETIADCFTHWLSMDSEVQTQCLFFTLAPLKDRFQGSLQNGEREQNRKQVYCQNIFFKKTIG